MARFKPYNYDQSLMIPVTLAEQIEPGTFEYALHHLIEARYDDSFLAEAFANDDTGRPAYPPKLLLKAILFAYSLGILSSRKIENACRHNIRFMALICGGAPDHSTIAAFIQKLGDQVEDVFAEVLCVCHEEGLLEGTHFAVDGLKLPTDAAKEWSGTFAALKKKRDKFRKKARALMAEHKRRDRRLAKGKTEVTGDTRSPAEKLLEKARKIDAFLAENEPRAGVNGKEVQSNLTDPESSKMHTSKGTVQGYNCQALVEGSHQIVTSAHVPEGGQDGRVLGELFEHAAAQAEAAGLGAGYKSVRGIFRKYRITGNACDTCRWRGKCLNRIAKKRTLSICIETANPHCQAMRAKVDTKEARRRYSYRMGTIEPVFSNLRHAKGMNRINYRGREKVGVIWQLWCIVHNIGKIALYSPEYGVET